MKRFGISLLFFAWALVSCSEGSGSTLYFTSFEKDTDVRPWNGAAKEMLIKDAAPNGGEQSIKIGGGCIQPAAAMPLNILETGYYKISFWAKMVEGDGAGISMRHRETGVELTGVAISGDAWNYYESDRFALSAGDPVDIEIYAGGIVFAETEVDLIDIRRVE